MSLFNFFRQSGRKTKVEDVPYGLKYDPVIPKGCKRYYFNKDGTSGPTKTSYHHIEIIALNDRNAIRKFQNLQN